VVDDVGQVVVMFEIGRIGVGDATYLDLSLKTLSGDADGVVFLLF